MQGKFGKCILTQLLMHAYSNKDIIINYAANTGRR